MAQGANCTQQIAAHKQTLNITSTLQFLGVESTCKENANDRHASKSGQDDVCGSTERSVAQKQIRSVPSYKMHSC